MTKQTNTPKLRFPEFKNEWSKLTMNDFLMEDKQYGTQKDTNFPIVTSSRQGLYIQNKYFEGDRSFANENVTFSIVPINYFTYRHMSDDDIFKFNINKFNTPILVSKEYPVFTVKNTFSQNFIFYELNNNMRFLKFCRIQKKGGARTRLYFKNLLKYQTYFPNYEEQQKIGAFFYLLDQQIELEQKKLELLEQQKKGYMQKIFSQQLRFKDENGNDYPKWENKLLGNLVNITMGQSPSSKNYTENSNYTTLVQGNADLNNGYIQPRIYTKQITKLAEVNDILLTVRAPVGKIGRAQLKACIGRGVCAIKGDSFIYYFLELFDLQNKWIRFSQGSTFESISGNEIKNIDVAYPINEERQKISEFLSKLDELLKNQLLKVEQLKQRKQGLLQKMFV
ncbi:restriction endonuclease subunit S [Staphylococcus argensis]|uniref:Restriction endonuclease subunit S n=2 Tax=Staphylococcus argensis TaxID=1607738 RepID=A0A2K4FB91_9STAP|nr:restriction endonuclease subunit S [Staphylococcus argensis]MCY6991731.1 restriction endonuclease subunit S [Staphylococcus argensis]POA08533.1 restriction endonuclease subunit S [Staphylococcus argensis]